MVLVVVPLGRTELSGQNAGSENLKRWHFGGLEAPAGSATEGEKWGVEFDEEVFYHFLIIELFGMSTFNGGTISKERNNRVKYT